jgi:hypothetical protein
MQGDGHPELGLLLGVMGMDKHHVTVSYAYSKIIDILLRLKAEGVSTDALADAIARAAREAGVERIK